MIAENAYSNKCITIQKGTHKIGWYAIFVTRNGLRDKEMQSIACGKVLANINTNIIK